MSDELRTSEERFWGVEFWHSLGWTPCSPLMLTRKKATAELNLWRSRAMRSSAGAQFKYRIASYVRKTP